MMPLIIWFLLIIVMGIIYGKIMNYIGGLITSISEYIKSYFSSRKN